MADKGFEHLDFYQDSLKLLKAAYRLAGELPDYERYNLADQLRRAACSVVLNIAEGYGRYHYLDRLRFLYIARGSLAETFSAFIIASNVGYCSEERLRWVTDIQERIEKNLNGYCRFVRSQQQGGTEYGARYIAEDQAIYDYAQSLLPSPQSPIPNPLSQTGD